MSIALRRSAAPPALSTLGLLGLALSSCALLGLSRPAAAQTTYTSSAAFTAALGGAPTTTEGYETPPPNTLISNGTTLDGLTYSGLPVGVQGRIDNTYFNFGSQSLAASRPSNPIANFFRGGESFTVTFAAPMTAVGIFFNANNSAASVNGDFFIQTPVGTANTGAAYDQTTFYFAGLISNTPFTTATFGSSSANNGANVFNADNLTYRPSAPVPEASTTVSLGLLLLLGMGGMVVAARRRKTA